MRKSAAPSQLGQAAKRPRFAPPLLKGSSFSVNGGVTKPVCASAVFTPPPSQHSTPSGTSNSRVANKPKERSTTDVLKLIQHKKASSYESERTACNDENNFPNSLPNSHDEKDFTRLDGRLSPDVPTFSLESNSTCSSQEFQQDVQNETCISVTKSGVVPVDSLRTVHSVNCYESPPSTRTECDDTATKENNFFRTVHQPVGTTCDISGNPQNGSGSEGVEGEYTSPSQSKLIGFKTPSVMGKSPLLPANAGGNYAQAAKVTADCDPDEPQTFYFNVMWCKLSKKKHKKWEGDAILLTKGRTVTLLDTEGKQIGKGTGYKKTQLESLEEGQTLAIGGKEIEVMSILSEEEFKCGQCFETGTLSAPSAPVERPAVISKPFVKPQKAGSNGPKPKKQQQQDGQSGSHVGQARYDPHAPGALVMPRPSQTHQWEYNKSKLPVVDVVVDPYLSQHLRPHQRQGVIFLYECVMGMRNYKGTGAILADEMGLGKTLQCICLIWTLLKQGPYGSKCEVKKALVITPGSLVKNWSREFRKWLGNERLHIFPVGPDKKVEEFIASPFYPVLVISYEMFVRSLETLKQVHFDLVVCDEGHRLKNNNIKTTTSVASLTTRRRVILTGTPVQNDLQELFSLVDFCNPGILGSSNSFRHVYEDPIIASRQPNSTRTEQRLGESRASELNRITDMFIIRRTSDINNKYLPPKVELVLFCQLSELQLKLYRKMLMSRVIRSCLTNMVDSSQHLMCIAALKKLCNHPSLIYESALQAQERAKILSENNIMQEQLYKYLVELYPDGFHPGQPNVCDSGKLIVLATLLRSMYQSSPRQRVVVVSNYTQTLNVVEGLCSRQGYSFLRLDGQTPTAKRLQLVERFNGQYSQDFCFLLSSKAGGVGLNLIGASRLILFDIDWNPANDLQAMARVWRDGQRRKVYIYRLLSKGSIEEKMYQRQISKQALSGVVVDAKTNTQLHFSPEELKDLFGLDETTLCGTHELLNCDCKRGMASSTQQNPKPDEVLRHCQLQPTTGGSATKKKNVCMDELMDWHHEHGPQPILSQVDPVLCDTELEQVTFAFWNESNSIEDSMGSPHP